MNPKDFSNPPSALNLPREQRVVNSALWAAAGDALGWMTELSHGPAGVKRRTGVSVVTEPLPWQRVVGGRTGPKVDLPAGTYSDDTQLRLSVSRSIRGNGHFDVEAFAKIELTVWPTYALGGGLGSKAAALGLSKRGVNWFSNFFDAGGQRYVSGGGNGAAMRIQPHVWASDGSVDKVISDVLRDALVTHGHPHGFCGAVFHALCLIETFKTGALPSHDVLHSFIEYFERIPQLIREDSQLGAFWHSTWEQSFGAALEVALDEVSDHAHQDLNHVLSLLDAESQGGEGYHRVLEHLGCMRPEFRGSGMKTALAALALSYIFQSEPIEVALACAANELESDTDTIATMCGALLGSLTARPPEWDIQDREYLISEAKRMASIARRESQPSFSYPDLGHWNPPTNQTAAVGRFDGGLAIAGLGQLTPLGTEYQSGDAVWQWFELPFGQTILAKRKSKISDAVPLDQLPGATQKFLNKSPMSSPTAPQPELFSEGVGSPHNQAAIPANESKPTSTELSIDAMTDEVIQSNFDDRILGQQLNRYIDASQSIESAFAFVAIIAKAKIARHRRKK